ncbi:MAG: hypothetical protein ACOYL3_16415 [Desulfuromonadaceae bacterium]
MQTTYTELETAQDAIDTEKAIQAQAGELALQIIKNWKSDESLRAEFSNNFSRYIAYATNHAAGNVKMVS